jgi:hypothetical protein
MSSSTIDTSPGHNVRAAQDLPYRSTERRTFTETKLGFKTSEFMMAVVGIAGILVATYADENDSLTLDNGWLYASLVAVAYIVSRGFAKLGVREPYSEDHDR